MANGKVDTSERLRAMVTRRRCGRAAVQGLTPVQLGNWIYIYQWLTFPDDSWPQSPCSPAICPYNVRHLAELGAMNPIWIFRREAPSR